MGPIGCPETSVRNYHYSPCNDPEERSSQLLRGGSLKSRKGPVTCLKHAYYSDTSANEDNSFRNHIR